MRYRGAMTATTRPLSRAQTATAKELLRSAPFDEAVLARTLIYEVTIKTVGFRERPRRQ